MDYISHEQYAANVDARCSKDFHIKDILGVWVSTILGEFRDRADDIDQIKKLMFYGKMHEELNHNQRMLAAARNNAYGTIGTIGENGPQLHDQFTDKEKAILHAILGIASEAGELVQAFINAMCEVQKDGKSVEDCFDHVNLREEAGDVLWYVQLLLNAIGSNLGECLSVNDRKLEARYGPVFSAERANERDLDAERKELEK